MIFPCSRLPGTAHLINAGIDVEPIPQALEDMENQARHSIQKAKSNKITIRKIGKSAEKQRRPRVHMSFKPSCSFHFVAEKTRPEVVLRVVSLQQGVPNLAIGQIVMLSQPILEVVL